MIGEEESHRAGVVNPGSTYALPAGQRAQERVTAPGVPATVREEALSMLSNASKWPGPYAVTLTPHGALRPGHATAVTITLTAANGNGIPDAATAYSGTIGGRTQTVTLHTDAAGSVKTNVEPPTAGTVTLTARVNDLPTLTLTATAPHNPLAQRLVLAGLHTSAQASATLTVGAPPAGTGRLAVAELAADTGHGQAGAEFTVRDSHGRAVANGRTNSSGAWTTPGLPPGRYVLREVHAANGYAVASDRPFTITAGRTTAVTVTNAPLPAPPAPAPRSVPPGALPQTGA